MNELNLHPHLLPVPLEKAYRLLNHGPTVLVSAQDQTHTGVMTAAWACPVEFKPAKVSVVLDKSTMTRSIIENSGHFVLQVPNLKQLKVVYALGMMSQHDAPEKLRQCGVNLFHFHIQPCPLLTVARHGYYANSSMNRTISNNMICL